MLIKAKTLRCLLRGRRGGPLIEFAIIIPVLVAMLMGLFDLSEAMITLRRLTVSAQEISEAATIFAAGTNTLGSATSTQANQAMSIAQAIFPKWLGASPPSYGITLSSVAIVASPTNCTTGCTYTAQTVWSLAIKGGQPVLRPCGMLMLVADSAATSLTTLPTGVASPPALLVADVSTVYTPTFTRFITGPIQMMRSAYMPPRALGSKTYISLSVNGDYTGYSCAGFS